MIDSTTADHTPLATTETRPTAVDADSPAPVWPLGKRIGFRFLTLYLLLYALPFPLNEIPWLGDHIGEGIGWFWRTLCSWLWQGPFGAEEPLSTAVTGSGDTTYGYLTLLCTAVLAVLGTVIWSLLDRKRMAYPRAAGWVVVFASYYLGLVLLSYGLAKVVPTQFGPPRLERLLTPYGHSSPMGIVWTFMGLSPAYTMFTGWMETVPALLLFFRRTRLAGACLAVAVMANVAIINFLFDVPVKLFSSHLLAIAAALVLVDGRRFFTFFFSRKAVPPCRDEPLTSPGRWRWVLLAAAVWLVGSSIWSGVSDNLEVYRIWGPGRERPQIWGIHDVETFVADGEEVPPLLTDEERWRALVVDRALPVKLESWEGPGMVSIQKMDGTLERRPVELDQDSGTLTFLVDGHKSVAAAEEAGAELPDRLRYERPEEGRLRITGSYGGRQVEIELAERDLEEMLLISRGFHWINEFPLNR